VATASFAATAGGYRALLAWARGHGPVGRAGVEGTGYYGAALTRYLRGAGDDAVQEAWIRLNRADAHGVDNPSRWLTTVVARVCLDMLRARTARREESLDGVHVPEPIVSYEDRLDPEQEALLADSVGLALLVVLDTLTPTERLAFVLHDMVGVPFSEIAPMVGRSPTAARQLASRARQRVQGAATPDPDIHRQRVVVDGFRVAARGGDFEQLRTVLDPNVVLRTDRAVPPAAPTVFRGAREVAGQALFFVRLAPVVRPALVNGAAGWVVALHGRPFAVLGFTVVHEKIVEIDVIADSDRINGLDAAAFDQRRGRPSKPDGLNETRKDAKWQRSPKAPR
jgi:RNA polymerase sigma-70 factor, ECF subfamily